MDKITAGIVDKLSIIGFFNVIVSGGVFLYGISPVLNRYVPGFLYMQLGLEQDLEKAVIMCLLCYIFGCVLKGIQSLLFGRIKAGLVNRCLAGAGKAEKGVPGKGILDNPYQRKVVTALAAKLFADRGLGQFDPEDSEMCRYFFEYCENSNSIKGLDGRASQLNESASFCEQLTTVFFTLAAVGIILSLFTGQNVWGYCLTYLAMGGVFLWSAWHSRRKWVGAVLTTYETATEQDEGKAKK